MNFLPCKVKGRLVRTIQALLVDDEPMALTNLSYVLTQFPDFAVAGTCTMPEEALEFCERHVVDVVFLDIEMPRIKGMELLNKMREVSPEAIFVFVTAYRDYAIKAFEVGAEDYLVKPVTKERMANAVQKIKQQLELCQAAANSSAAADGFDLIPGKANGRTYLLECKEICYITVEDRNVLAVTANGVYKLQNSLSYWADYLPRELFFRCHQGFIVNLEKIQYIAPFFKNAYSIKIAGSEQIIPVSRNYVKILKERFGL
jgi:DNA-binding LytR/AlgR family response regulator